MLYDYFKIINNYMMFFSFKFAQHSILIFIGISKSRYSVLLRGGASYWKSILSGSCTADWKISIVLTV